MQVRGRGVVLLVEDDTALREAIVEALRSEGHRIVAVADGRAAIRWLGGHVAPALILMDLWMPDMDGWQLRAEIEKHAHLRPIPIVVLTAATGQSATELKVAAVLEKPVTVPVLLEAVERYLA